MKKIYKGLEAHIIENENLQLTFLPQYGCKLASLISKKTGREFLFQSALEKLIIPSYGASFSAYDSSGFDEVFPSIDACPYPSGPFQGTPIPDHGEIWALPWQVIYEERENKIKALVHSQRLAYIFSREVTVEKNEVLFSYCVENTADSAFEFIWTPHCLLQCSPATRLLIPPELNQIITVEHATKHLGPWGTIHSYPITTDVCGQTLDLAATEPVSAHNCEKFYFTARNLAGWCGIEHTDTHERLIYSYPADKIPYLGVWKTQGGYRGDYNIALEPCTGIYDDLYVAHKMGRVAVLAPKATQKWTLKMTLS
ncbi:MAG: DUF5107 domain-containing protein [Elusimicrobiaceae bacterium]|nr:DUF5107 domain-containing protein [Elusimicrobiaceae bacterium]